MRAHHDVVRADREQISVRRHPRVEDAGRLQRRLEAGPVVVWNVAGEVDQPPQRCAGAAGPAGAVPGVREWGGPHLAGLQPGDLAGHGVAVFGRRRPPCTECGCGASVVVVEPTGAETELLPEVGGHQLIVVMHGRTDAQPDSTVYLAIDAAKAHAFDGASGKRLG